MEVLRFQTNISEQVALKFDDGKQVSGKYGDQILFTLTDGRLMFLPSGVAERIKELGIVKGEVFEIGKRSTAKDGKTFLEWEVTRLSQPEPVTPAPPVTPKLAVINGNSQKAEEAAVSRKMATATQLADALKTAIAAAAQAEEFAKSIDYSVRFTSEDIRTMGNTLLIGKQRENQNAGYR